MPGRITPLVSGEYYHIYNRGNEKRKIFTKAWDYKRFQKTFYYYQFNSLRQSFSKFTKADLGLFKPDSEKRIVEVVCYCLMPNHFHFLMRQLQENGISKFVGQLSNSYTKYFNTKYKRIGSLFQGTFKAVHINTDEQLLHVSRYIHLNPVVSGIVKKPESYRWSSYLEYIRNKPFYSSPQEILNFFSSPKKYQEFVEAQIDYGSTLEILKHKTIDIDN